MFFFLLRLYLLYLLRLIPSVTEGLLYSLDLWRVLCSEVGHVMSSFSRVFLERLTICPAVCAFACLRVWARVTEIHTCTYIWVTFSRISVLWLMRSHGETWIEDMKQDTRSTAQKFAKIANSPLLDPLPLLQLCVQMTGWPQDSFQIFNYDK